MKMEKKKCKKREVKEQHEEISRTRKTECAKAVGNKLMKRNINKFGQCELTYLLYSNV